MRLNFTFIGIFLAITFFAGTPLISAPAKRLLELARVRERNGVLISVERRRRRSSSLSQFLLRMYKEYEEAVAAKVLAVDQENLSLTVQELGEHMSRNILLEPGVAYSGVDSFLEIEKDDWLYIVYYLDIGGRRQVVHVHVIKSDDPLNPYDFQQGRRDDAVARMINLLSHGAPYQRAMAASVLGYLKDRRAVDSLANALSNDMSPLVRYNSVKSLGDIGDAWAVESLIMAFRDQNELVRYAAAGALASMGEPAVEPLIRALYSRYWLERMNAAESLGSLRSERAVVPLILALKDEDFRVRCNIIWALGEIGSAEAVEPLMRYLSDEHYLVRWFSADALGAIGDPIAIEPLIYLLRDDDENVREAAFRGLLTITGRNLGTDFKKWVQWWEENKWSYR